LEVGRIGGVKEKGNNVREEGMVSGEVERR
jgi:hypothetical protein